MKKYFNYRLRKLKNILCLTVLIVTLAALFSSCMPLRWFLTFNDLPLYSFYEEEEIESEEALKSPEYVGDREEITIGKNEGHKNEGDKVTSAGQAYNSISEVYYAVAASVVEITTETVQNSAWMGQFVSEGAGSGVIIDGKGFIVTNHHVVAGASHISVRLTTGEEFSAVIMGSDEQADLAVLKIDAGNTALTVAGLGCSGDLVVGEDIVVLGNPLGSLGGTLTTGIISATEREITVDGNEMVLLQTNAAINPVNSGGGLFNMSGELVGIVNAKMAGSDIEGLGFAIPVDYAHSIIEDLINYGYVKGIADHGLVLLDVTSQNLPAAYAKYGITNTGVVIIESHLTDKLQYGDTLISVNGESITSSGRFNSIIRSCAVGDSVTVKVNRAGKTVTVSYVLGEKQSATSALD